MEDFSFRNYTDTQVARVLEDIGVQILGDTQDSWTCLCPFHRNVNTTAMAVYKGTGRFMCFNPSCDSSGTLVSLVKRLGSLGEFEAMRFISTRAGDEAPTPFIHKLRQARKVFPSMPMEVVMSKHEAFMNTVEPQQYMKSRGFEKHTMQNFLVGYDTSSHMIQVPMFDITGNPIGYVGRALETKRFKNSPKLPVRDTLWNINNAKDESDVVIICESTFDAMRTAQAGYPNVVACLGDNFSDLHARQLQSHFNRVILFTDWDDTSKNRIAGCKICARAGEKYCKGHNYGRDMGNNIVEKMKGRQVYWASYTPGVVYPEGVKDATDMTTQQIRECIKNAVPNIEYQRWGLYYSQ